MDGILVINKPAGMTSFDVIARLRKKYGQKKFGHTGTLDPGAEGVLVVLAGRAAKILPYLQDTGKTYTARLELGTDTDTDDAWGAVVKTGPVNRDFDFEQELKKLEGPLHLRVPAASAKKVNGKKLLEYLRQGQEVPEVWQDIIVHDIHALDAEKLEFEVTCSSGTYVRSLCRQLAHNTGNCGHMASLLRTRAGAFCLEQAEPLDKEVHTVHSIREALSGLPVVQLEDVTPVLQGKPLDLDRQEEMVLITDGQGEAVAIYEKRNGCYRSRRGLW